MSPSLPNPLPPPPPPPPPMGTSPSQSSHLLISTIATTSFAAVFVFGRLYTRLALTRNFGWDDIFLSISLILGISLAGLICALAHDGVGRHVEDVAMSNAYNIQVLGFSVRMIHIVVLTTTKLSICLFYRRIFQDSISRTLSVALMAFMTVFTLALFIDGFFACNLGGAYWSPAGPLCGRPSFVKNIAFFVYGSAVLSVVADLFLMAFALWRIFPLGIARAQKISLYAVISLGWLAIAASLIRAILTGQTIDSRDPTWAAYNIDIWASIEVNTGLVCASAPALKPLVRKILPNFLTSISERSSRRNNHVHINENGYLRATSRSGDGGAIELAGRSHHTDSTRVTQKELHSRTSDKIDIDGHIVGPETRVAEVEDDGGYGRP